MHEQRSAKILFDKAIQHPHAEDIRQIQVAIGEISELDQGIIQQQWVELSKGTALERAQIRFRLITAEAQCMACFKKYYPVNGTIHCPHCGSFGAKILSGEEFYVEHIETK
ncbi:MAG: hydrogenase maturation nickel metallochaperone HypA [Anaerolineales bacterium]|nr:hydrogenase maturation nickel metallochaperone HypA [Anaerolineales bacterium]